ncbi:MAG: YeeE/YedE family protein [Bacteroidetes bacterium]|nr:MAG: YeeE/YedE family protein [Bacteroidota bacterium]
MEVFLKAWAWYTAGPLLGLIVPFLLLIGNKSFGISSTLRQICAMCVPAKIPYFQYNWKSEIWNLFFVSGIIIGAFLASNFISDGSEIMISEQTKIDLAEFGITNFEGLAPKQLFSWQNLLTLNGFIFVILGGFLVGFGTRYANGCTSGHSIMGLSNLQLSSLVATICFMIGGIFSTHILFPLIFE